MTAAAFLLEQLPEIIEKMEAVAKLAADAPGGVRLWVTHFAGQIAIVTAEAKRLEGGQ